MKRVIPLSTVVLVLCPLILLSDLWAQTTNGKGDPTRTATKTQDGEKQRHSDRERTGRDLAPPKKTGTSADVGASRASAVRETPQTIADAKAKGLVWVNTATRVYHKDGPSYGTTKRGKFMTEEEAKKAGFRMANDGGRQKTTPDR